jgi:hypothetical protein
MLAGRDQHRKKVCAGHGKPNLAMARCSEARQGKRQARFARCQRSLPERQASKPSSRRQGLACAPCAHAKL